MDPTLQQLITGLVQYQARQNELVAEVDQLKKQLFDTRRCLADAEQQLDEAGRVAAELRRQLDELVAKAVEDQARENGPVTDRGQAPSIFGPRAIQAKPFA